MRLFKNCANARRMREERQAESAEEREDRLDRSRSFMRENRDAQSDEQHRARNQEQQGRAVARRDAETPRQEQLRLEQQRAISAAGREVELPQQRQIRNQHQQARASARRDAETPRQEQLRLEQQRAISAAGREVETPQQCQLRNQEERSRSTIRRNVEASPAREQRQAIDRNRHAQSRERTELNMAAFNYDPKFNYEHHRNILIGQMDKVCRHCQAIKYEKETPGMCCSNGKVKLPTLNEPPPALLNFFGPDPLSRHFLQEIRKYNSCFQMTSFGATKIATMGGYMPTFKVQGQIYHKIGSLLPVPDQDTKFLQIYFMGNEDEEINQRCAAIPGARRAIVADIQRMLHQENQLVRVFKMALDQMPADDYRVVIRADKTPSNEHERRFNAPTINEVAIVMVGQEFERRNIIIERRNTTLKRIAETHRSYDALQYPLLFCRGKDGYHFHIKRVDPVTGEPTNKKVCINYYQQSTRISRNVIQLFTKNTYSNRYLPWTITRILL